MALLFEDASAVADGLIDCFAALIDLHNSRGNRDGRYQSADAGNARILPSR